MFKIDHSTAVAVKPTPKVAGTPGYFTEGDPVGGIAPTILSADFMNALQDELIGVLAAASVSPDKTKSDQLLTALKALYSPSLSQAARGSFKNLSASTTGSSVVVSVTADEVVLGDAGANSFLAKNINLSINGATGGSGGLDTGALAANTWYAVWLVSDGSSTVGLLSLSGTAPTMPAGLTYKTRIGWVRTLTTSAFFPIIQKGRRVQFKLGTGLAGFPTVISGVQGNIVTPTWVAASVSSVVPSTAARIMMQVNLPANTTGTVAVAPNASSPAYNSTSSRPLVVSFANTASGGPNNWGEFTLESTNIYYSCDIAGGFACCMGWEDNI